MQNSDLFKSIKSHIDAMLDFGREGTDEGQCPLFAGVIDPKHRLMMLSMIAPPPGIRMGDMNWCGNNLIHDVPVLEVMRGLSKVLDDKRYVNEISGMFKYYVEACPHPETGLFPWGEHAQWSIRDKKCLPHQFVDGLSTYEGHNYMIHEHLKWTPQWFLDELWQASPEVVMKFVKSLDRHIVDTKTFEHNRHAPMTMERWHDPEVTPKGAGKDFARHAGFFIYDHVFAFQKSGDATYWDWAMKKIRYHLDRRLPSGLIRGCIRTDEFEQEGQHLQFALSLAEASDLLDPQSSEGKELKAIATEVLEAKKQHWSFEAPQQELGDACWIAGYFQNPDYFQPAGLEVDFNTHMPYPELVENVLARADHAQKLSRPQTPFPILARVFSEQIDLQLSAYQLSSNRDYLDHAATLADWAKDNLYCEGMWCGASGMKISNGKNVFYLTDPHVSIDRQGLYYSCSGTPALLRNLFRLCLLQDGQDDFLGTGGQSH